MNAPRTFNVYCDESCHLEHDNIPVMAWGAVYCPAARRARRRLRRCGRSRLKHGLKPDFEV